MEAPKNKWQGKRAIIVVRQSNDKDGTASTAAQLDFMAKEIEKVGMCYVDNVAMEGVPGSAPARMSEVLEGLVARKKKSDDFDVIAWQVEDRASRGGGDHGMWQEHEAKRNGILFFFAGDDQPTGPFAAVGRVAKYEAAKDMSFGNGRRTAQGQAWAQKQGFFRTSGQTPMACDRIYYGSDDKPKFILHNLPNGLQEQRDYATDTVIGTYGTEGKKSYQPLPQATERIFTPVPGRPGAEESSAGNFLLAVQERLAGCTDR